MKRKCHHSLRIRRLRKYRSFLGLVTMLHALGICDSIWRRDEFCFRQFFYDCFPSATSFDAEEAYKREIARIPARLARASRQGQSRP